MTIRETIWEMESHTGAKHEILKNYLNAWLPIMTSWNGRVIFLDGFAGPGEYKGGETGSPIIALDAALHHKQPIKAEVRFFFIESRPDRYQHLVDLLDSQYKPQLPQNLIYTVHCAKFDETLREILDYLEEHRSQIAPTFAFIDPFGYSDTPFEIVQRLMKHPRCEVLINFNFEELNRFLSVESQWSHFDRQFGTNDWRQALEVSDPPERQHLLHDLYKRQLESGASIKYVLSFRMVNIRNNTGYFLFFGTNGYEGLRQMKRAMWRVDPAGAYSFTDLRDFSQPYLIEPTPDYDLLKRRIIRRFAGRDSFTDEALEHFIIEETPFLDTHYKMLILKPMEQAGELEVVSTPRKRRFTYPLGTILKIP